MPEDCLTKVVGEFQECHNLGFIQCRTTPLRAEDNYWEVRTREAKYAIFIFFSKRAVRSLSFFVPNHAT